MNSRQLFWCRFFQWTAILLIVAAYWNGYRFWQSAIDNDYRRVTSLTFLAGACVAKGIKESSKNLFDTRSDLWFACFSGFVYIGFILVVVTSMFVMLSAAITDPIEFNTLRPKQMMFMLPASSIAWLLCSASVPLRDFPEIFRLWLSRLSWFFKAKDNRLFRWKSKRPNTHRKTECKNKYMYE